MENADGEFREIFLRTKNNDEKFESPLKVPRVSYLQKNRMDIKTKDPEKYYLISISIPYIDSFIDQLKSRFIDHKNYLKWLSISFRHKSKKR